MGDLGPESPPRQRRAPPAPRPRRAEAEREARRLASLYSDFELEIVSGFGLCFFFGALLMCNISCSAALTVRRVYGSDARVVAAAGEAIMLSVGTALYFGMIALIAYLRKRSYQLARQAAMIGGDRPAVQRPAADRDRWGAIYAGLFTRDLHMASCVLMVVGRVMLSFAPANSHQWRAGFMVAEAAWFLHSVALCFIICAAIKIQWRSACASLRRRD